jgi:hypothetical protein
MRLLLITGTHGKLGSINELATYVQACIEGYKSFQVPLYAVWGNHEDKWG